MIVAIIPAKGHSERIPRKNLVPLLGKPLIAHSIETALQATSLDRIIISTDDADIAKVADSYGVEIIWRPAELCTPTATSESAIIHALRYLENEDGKLPDLVVFLQATSPYRLPDDIEGAVELFYKSGADSVFSATPEHFTGRWRLNGNGSVHPVNYDPLNRPRSQDYPVEYLGIGSIYVFRPPLILETGCRTGGKIVPFLMPKLRSFQVDTYEDLETLEFIMKAARGYV